MSIKDKLAEELAGEFRVWQANAIRHDNPCSSWIKGKAGKIYIRKMARKGVICLANIDIEEEYRGVGLLTEFIAKIKENNLMFTIIQIESIDNKRLKSHLRSIGWIDSPCSCEFTITLETSLL